MAAGKEAVRAAAGAADKRLSAEALCALGRTLWTLGRQADALQALERGCAVAKSTDAAVHSSLAEHLACLRVLSGSSVDGASPLDSQGAVALAATLLDLGRADEAAATAQRALDDVRSAEAARCEQGSGRTVLAQSSPALSSLETGAALVLALAHLRRALELRGHDPEGLVPAALAQAQAALDLIRDPDLEHGALVHAVRAAALALSPAKKAQQRTKAAWREAARLSLQQDKRPLPADLVLFLGRVSGRRRLCCAAVHQEPWHDRAWSSVLPQEPCV